MNLTTSQKRPSAKTIAEIYAKLRLPGNPAEYFDFFDEIHQPELGLDLLKEWAWVAARCPDEEGEKTR